MMLGLLLGQPMSIKRANELCISQAAFGTHVRLIMNCDSFDFMELLANPRALMRMGENRQSRPVFIIAGAILGRVFEPVANVLLPLLTARPISEINTSEQVNSEIRTLISYLTY
jgi:hypothetical protein